MMRAIWPLFVVALAAGFLLREIVPVPSFGKTVAGFLFLLLAGALAWLAATRGRHLALYVKGAQGEERVARELALLPSTYAVFHGVQIERPGFFARRGDYDHVVVGASGVYLVETKNWSGRITIEDGKVLCDGVEPDRQPIDQVKAAAAQLYRRIGRAMDRPPTVQPILCFAASRLPEGRQGTGGVVVCDVDNLNALILETGDGPIEPEAQTHILRLLGELCGAADGAPGAG